MLVAATRQALVNGPALLSIAAPEARSDRAAR
jgi:hypothetical protein